MIINGARIEYSPTIHLVRGSVGMSAEYGMNYVTTACGRELIAYVRAIDSADQLTCKQCNASPAGRSVPAALAIQAVTK